MDAQSREFDSWEEVVKKAINVEAKTLLQPPSNTWEKDSSCLQGNKPAKKEKKDSKKTKSIDTPSADVSSDKHNNFPPIRAKLAKNTRITKEVLGAEEAKRVITMTFLQ